MKKLIVITTLIALALNLVSSAAFAVGGFCRGVDKEAPICED